MALSDYLPFGKAAKILQEGMEEKDKAAKESSQPKKDERVVKAAPDKSRDPAERKELEKSAQRLRDYRIQKSISGDTPAESRLYDLQTRSYKKGTKKVKKTGVAKLHKGEAVLNKKAAKKFRARKGAARLLGAGKMKAKKSRG